VLGCVAQQEGEGIFERAPWVSLVCGSASYRKLPQLIAELEAGNRRVTGLDTDTDETFETEITRRDNPFRAYLTIIEGCDKACSYCVVPFTRGPERSRASASILEEVRRLAEAGYSEVQLLGPDGELLRGPERKKDEIFGVAGGGGGSARDPAREIHDFAPAGFRERHRGGDRRASNDLRPGALAGAERLNGGARAMARTYTREEYLEKIALLKAARRPISISTDVIVGFPGETEKDFEETLSLLDEVQYDNVLRLSIRRGRILLR